MILFFLGLNDWGYALTTEATYLAKPSLFIQTSNTFRSLVHNILSFIQQLPFEKSSAHVLNQLYTAFLIFLCLFFC